jgi:hypothetical protein
VNHYEVLGVDGDVSPAELRRAYLDLARRHHPDRQAGVDPQARGVADERMRQINSAWQVLGDPGRRSAYDLLLRQRADHRSGTSTAGAVAPKGPRIERPSTAFSPYWEHDEDDDDSWRYEPDEINPETVPPRLLLAAPAATFVLGIGLLAASAPTGIRSFMAVGLISLVFSALLFVGAPVVALFKSQITEERSRRRRR